MTWNSFFTLVDIVWPVLTWWTRFWPKNGLKLIFLPWSTWFDPYWLGGLGFDRKWRFWPETAWNLFFTLVDMVWPVLTRWTRFWSKMMVLTRKLIFYLADMVWPVLTRWNRFLWKDAVDSRKIYFWIFLFLIFFWIFINNNRNKITFEKILVDPKLGYNNRNPKGTWIFELR